MEKVYLDNAATTIPAQEVIDEMVNVLKNNFGNPSSIHSFGREAKVIIERVRKRIADYLKVTPGEIIFTSCGTESNNMIVRSAVEHLGVERIITSPLEHKCVAETVVELNRRKGIEVIYLRPDVYGDIDPQKIEEALKSSDKKTLVTLMHANNEIGNILDIKKVAELCKKYGALFHSDTIQTVGHLHLDFSDIPLDFASCSAHKFHGPKGTGFTFIRKSTGLKGIITGGSQERSLRAGTENIYGIAGLGKAIELAINNLDDYARHIKEIKEYTVKRLSKEIPGIKFNGRSAGAESLYTVLSLLLPYQDKDQLIGLQLDIRGIAVSQGSACSSGASKPSMVMVMLLDEDDLEKGSPLRISFSHLTTKDDIDLFVNALKQILSDTSKKNNLLDLSETN